jgi:hypothetical protein
MIEPRARVMSSRYLNEFRMMPEKPRGVGNFVKMTINVRNLSEEEFPMRICLRSSYYVKAVAAGFKLVSIDCQRYYVGEA